MSKYNYPNKKINSFIPDIPINEDSRDKLFSLATSHDIGELENFITTNSISLNVKNNNNQTIIHVLLDTGNTTDEKELLRCIKFLVERGVYISNSDKNLSTPLFICIKKNYSEIFKYLLEKGANSNINTYDNLTVMHVLAQPGYITYDANGIQSIIPEKLPIITMEKYKIIYDKIQDVLNKNIFNISKLDDIAKQFYYHDNLKEDFNNVLLIDEYKENLNNEQKNDLLGKLQNQLESFYDNSNEIIEDNIEDDLNEKLTNITFELNDNITSMQSYNEDVLKAIKNLALSLELSIHYFFLQDPVNTYIAIDVAIAIAEKATTTIDIRDILNSNNVRPSVNAVQYTATAQRTIPEFIDYIQKKCVIMTAHKIGGVFQGNENRIRQLLNILVDPPGTPANLSLIFQTIKNKAKIAAYPGYINPATGLQVGIIPPIIGLVNNALITPIPLVVPARTIQNNIQEAANDATATVLLIKSIDNNIKDAITAYVTLGNPDRLQVLAVLQATCRAAVFAAVYAQNTIDETVANISAVHTATDATIIASIEAAALTAVPPLIINQEILQRELTNSIIAVETVVRATIEAVIAVNVIAVITEQIMIESIQKALENIDVNKESIKTIIAIANEAIGGGILNIVRVLSNKDVIREAIVAVEAAEKAKGTNKQIINYIREIVTNEAVNPATAPGTILTSIQNIPINDIELLITQAIDINDTATRIQNEIIDALTNINNPIIQSVNDALITPIAVGPVVTIQNNIQEAADDAINVIIYIKSLEKKIKDAITVYVQLGNPDRLQVLAVLAVLQVTLRASVFAAVYAANTIWETVANISAIHAATDASVIAALYAAVDTAAPRIVANQEELQKELQNALKDQTVAIESVVIAATKVSEVVYRVNFNYPGFITPEIMKEAIKKALRLPPIIPEKFKNIDYNILLKSYKLINIPQKYINYNISYNYGEDFVGINIKSATKFIKYKLPEDNISISYCIDYFNLLYTFIEYANDNNNNINDIDKSNIFLLYQHIQQIYKYNYIIYIFDKEKDKIFNLKDNYTSLLNPGLKETINKLFETNYYELVKSVDKIKKQLETINKLANNYIDNYNKLNGYKIYKNPNANNIGIYPKIQFSTEIKHSLGDENAIIAKCKDYITYNNNKNDFFHNFVLYFQDIGLYKVLPNNNLLNNIPIPIKYNILINNYNTNIPEEKNKGNKLYFYDPIYLKLEKQKLIRNMLINNEIISIRTENKDIYNLSLSKELDNKIKKTILNEILENKFDTFLNNAIDNLLKEEVSLYRVPIEFNNDIKEPDFNAILLESLGFKHILIPNYEFTNNKFLSISKNKFLTFILYFDTKYFELTNISILNYYKNNNSYIDNLLEKNKPLIFKTDIKGQTPIYYAIDGNNYNVIEQIINNNKNTLYHYDNKNISPLRLCINKQLHHLNYLLDDDNDNYIHYLNNYIKMLRTELKSNKILIPLNIDAVFIIALFIQNDIWRINKKIIVLDNSEPKNTRKIQINDKINTITSEIENSYFNFYDNKVENATKKPNKYKKNTNKEYDGNSDQNIIFKKYYSKARKLEKQDFGLYGSYWINYKKYKNNLTILDHINNSINIKEILKELQSIEKKNNNNNFNLPKYDNDRIDNIVLKLENTHTKLEYYLKFINIRFNSNKDNAYTVFLNKIYVHVLANIIGVDFYLTIEELIIKHYIGKGAIINDQVNVDNIKNNLRLLNKLLINNKLDEETNINYSYIKNPIPESVLKDKIKNILLKIIPNDNNELINTFETVLLPRYRDLYRITYKYLKMFIENYHKFIYNQYHGLEILLLLLSKL
jgi:hypothetical protein